MSWFILHYNLRRIAYEVIRRTTYAHSIITRELYKKLLNWFIDLNWFELIWFDPQYLLDIWEQHCFFEEQGGYPVPEKNARENKSHLIMGWRDKMRWVPYWSLTTTQCRLLTLFVAISYITFITFLHILKYNKCSIYTVLCMRFVMEYKKTTAHLQHLQTIIRPLKLNYVLLTV